MPGPPPGFEAAVGSVRGGRKRGARVILRPLKQVRLAIPIADNLGGASWTSRLRFWRATER